LLVAGLGLTGGLALLFLLLTIAAQALPPREGGRLVLLGFGAAIVVLLLDLYGPGYRLPVPQLLQIATAVAAVVLVLLYAVLAVRRSLNYNLRAKLIISFLIVVLVSLSVQAYLNDRATRAALTGEANQALFGTASQAAVGIDAFIRANLSDLRTEAQIPVLRDYLSLSAGQRAGSTEEEEVATTLSVLGSKDVVNIASYALLDGQGQNLVDTAVSAIGEDESGKGYFQVPVQTGLSYVSPVVVSEATGRGLLYFGSPVRGAGGEVVGVLRVCYNAAVLQRMVAQGTGLAGVGSFGVLFDENHIVLAHGTSPETVFKSAVPLGSVAVAELQAAGRLPDWSAEELSLGLPDLERGLADAEVQPNFTTELAVPGAGLHSAGVVALETQSWLLAFFQPQEVFLEPAARQTQAMAILAVVIAVVTAALAFVVARFLAGPITRLTAVAEEVAAGDLAARARVESGDEIGVLATTFNSMTAQLSETLRVLERRVEERTRGLQTAAEVSRATTSVLDLGELLPQVVEVVQERFGLYYVGLFLLDEAGEWAVLRAGTGEAGQVMLGRGHRIRVGEGMVGWSIANEEARIALDVGEDAVRLATEELPETRSEMALPLRSRGRVLGAMTVQSVEEAAFDEADIAVLQTMADQVAVAIDNARLFAEAQVALEAERRAYRELSREAWSELLRTRPDLEERYDPHGVLPTDGQWREEFESAVRQGRVVLSEGEPSTLAAPITVRGQIIGTIDAHKPSDAGRWTSEEIALVETLTAQLGLALESARLYQETQLRATRERLAGTLTARIRAATDVDGVLRAAVQEIRRALGASHGVVRMVTETPLRSAEGDGKKAEADD
jgi:GAF domain-containing protein/HAMP domain-containing protein